jgi:POT family proton-dependent oligopeptide transporter
MFGHPKGLFMLFCTEMWERSSFYGMQAILVLYIIGKTSSGGMGWSNSEALQLYGTYVGLAYMTPLLGGWIADRFIGQRASVMIGGVLMAAGHFLIAFNELAAFYTALALIAVGNGFFKPCVSSILGGLYSEKDSRRDSAYSIFYMGINIGALLGSLVAGWLQVNYGYDWGFGAAGVGMLIGIGVFWYTAKHHLGDVGKRPKPKQELEIRKQPLTKLEKRRITVILIMAVVQTLYVMAWVQGGGLLTIYAEQHTDRMLGGWEVPASWFNALNPFFIILFAPLLSIVWNVLGKKGRDFSFITKFAIGFLLTGLSFLVLVVDTAELNANPQYMTSIALMVGFYAIYTLAELLLFPVFWSAVSRLASPRNISLLMAVALSSIGLGAKLGGTVGSYVDELGPQKILSGVMITMFVLGGICLLLNKKLMRMTEADEGSLKEADESPKSQLKSPVSEVTSDTLPARV